MKFFRTDDGKRWNVDHILAITAYQLGKYVTCMMVGGYEVVPFDIVKGERWEHDDFIRVLGIEYI